MKRIPLIKKLLLIISIVFILIIFYFIITGPITKIIQQQFMQGIFNQNH